LVAQEEQIYKVCLRCAKTLTKGEHSFSFRNLEAAANTTPIVNNTVIEPLNLGRMSIVDTKAFMLPPAWHSISGHKIRVIRIPV